VRTTIELPDEQRARLLEIAASRGKKGFSEIVQEAIAAYLEAEGQRTERIAAALALRGTVRGRSGSDLSELTRAARETWR
jgi:predicted transcriptional regulator